MNQEEYEKKFFALLKAMGEYYDKSFSGIVYEIWFNDIRRFDYKAVKRAFAIHRQNPASGKFMPKSADIIGILEGSHQSNSFIAWTKVKKAFGAAGQYQSVVFDDPIIHSVISDMGGWIRFCQSQEREQPFLKKEFTERYQAFKTSGGVVEYPKQLEGLHNAENRQKGLIEHIESPVLIGNKNKAQKVLTGSNIKQLD